MKNKITTMIYITKPNDCCELSAKPMSIIHIYLHTDALYRGFFMLYNDVFVIFMIEYIIFVI